LGYAGFDGDLREAGWDGSVLHRLDVPSVSLEAGGGILGVEAERGVTVDRDVVVVVEVDDAAEAEMTGEGRPSELIPSIRSPSELIPSIRSPSEQIAKMRRITWA
jgi:hypothetical protein